MEKFYDRALVETYLQETRYKSAMKDLQERMFTVRYEKGELVTSPLQGEHLFQIVVKGTVSIYFIRDDGSLYSLADGRRNYLLGEMEIFSPQKENVYAEANEDLICLALSIEKCREELLANCLFLQQVCESLVRKMEAITALDAAPATLKQRVLTYMKYKCSDGELKGLEQAAFHLHCSARQLQRILRQCEAEGIARKTGKGAYKLCKHPLCPPERLAPVSRRPE